MNFSHPRTPQALLTNRLIAPRLSDLIFSRLLGGYLGPHVLGCFPLAVPSELTHWTTCHRIAIAADSSIWIAAG